ncbi:MAG: RDD family protein [Bryobacteraceae bacterium]|jgi:uncharacterized RDD family membrane protein YckC
MREYRAEETGRMQDLDGLPLADFWQRAAAFATDAAIAVFFVAIVLFIWGAAKWVGETGGDMHKPRSYHIDLKENEWVKIALELGVPVLYFGLSTFLWNGRTPGKRLFGVRVVSLVHERMSLWHSIERALGYGAATLEFGFGFLQFFIHPYRRTAQDRLAETIVVKEKAYRARFAAPD